MSPLPLSRYHQPAEWEPHRACWLAWPSHAELWQEDFPGAQLEFTALCRAIAKSERLEILVPTEATQAQAEEALEGLPVRFHRIAFGDIWLRDTAPIFVKGDGGVATVSFDFNGWGGKYNLPHDPEVSTQIALAAGQTAFRQGWILEGGSVEVDGQGTCLTTRQCLLNSNRNSGLDQGQIETRLRDALGARKVLWLEEGLINDHTDGHIDTLARFIAPGEVLCMAPSGADDPNAEVLKRLQSDLSHFTDAEGRKLKVRTVSSPGKIVDRQGKILPASYLNFYIANRTVVVPVYGSMHDAVAVETIGHLFPGRATVGLSAKAILSGGGAFHCITQQEPTP